MEKNKSILALKLLVSLVVCQLAGLVGAMFTTSEISTWYRLLQKPFFSPPNYLFAPVWTLPFVAMAVALFLVWIRIGKEKEKRLAMILFALQLFFNMLWSVVFFGLHSPLAGVFIIIILLFLIIATTLKFLRLSQIAAILMLPYILWVSFATLLNIAIWILNR